MGEDGRQFAQIVCAHNRFEFPVLTFSVEQLMEIK